VSFNIGSNPIIIDLYFLYPFTDFNFLVR